MGGCGAHTTSPLWVNRSGSVRLFPFKALLVCALTAVGGNDSETGG